MPFTSDDLLAAERNVAKGVKHVAKQEAVVTELRLEGADTRLAEEVLAAFQRSLRRHREDRELIARELGRSG
jgi:hypothetical protein